MKLDFPYDINIKNKKDAKKFVQKFLHFSTAWR